MQQRGYYTMRLSRQCGIGKVRDFRERISPSCALNEFVYFVRVAADGPARILHTGTGSGGLGRTKSGTGLYIRNAQLGGKMASIL